MNTEIKTIVETLEKLTNQKVRLEEKLDPSNQYSYKFLKVVARQNGIDIEGFDPHELVVGYNEEHEHDDVTKGDSAKTLKIVVAHLKENPHYYAILKAAGLEEDTSSNFEMGLTAFGKPDDTKYNQDTVMAEKDQEETSKDVGASSGELALIEQIAEIQHEAWRGWAEKLVASEPDLSPKRVERWKTYFTSYQNLPNDVKEKDREIARDCMDVFKSYLKRRLKEKNESK